MARKRRSLLPPVTASDVEQCPGDVRRTAYGWAWKCAHCGQFACSETQAGLYVCRSHGGVTARQRCPETRLLAEQRGQPVSRPSGRPLKSGLYSRKPSVRLNELVAQFRQAQVDLDCTDEDMLYLRAYQQQRTEQHPQFIELTTSLEELQVKLEAYEETLPSASVYGLASSLREMRLLLRHVRLATREVVDGHERLILLSKVRAETRVKNHAARQVDVFTLLLQRLMEVLREQLSPADLAALQMRVAKELDALPAGLVDGTQRLRRS